MKKHVNLISHGKNAAKNAFTLAEVLITLAIIGVVAAITIPSVIVNTNQMEFKTGLRKAVSALNQAITLNKALTGESPYDNKDLFNYLQQYMSVMSSTNSLNKIYESYTCRGNTDNGYAGSQGCDDNLNAAFYTTDGMRFEFNAHLSTSVQGNKLHESDVYTCDATSAVYSGYNSENVVTCGGCGSYGLTHNPDNTTLPPCSILVDVNGDRKPTPGNIHCKDTSCAKSSNLYRSASPNSILLRDIFTILITDQGAIPYGVVAQKAMYQAQK